MAAVGFTADSLWLTRIALGAPVVMAAAQTLRPGLRGDFKLNDRRFSNVSWSLEGASCRVSGGVGWPLLQGVLL